MAPPACGRAEAGVPVRALFAAVLDADRPIHQHEPDHGPDAVDLRRPKQRLGGVRIGGRIGDDRGGAGGGERAHRERTEPLRGRHVELALERERVSLQPGQQVQSGTEPGVRELGNVRVEIDQAGHDQPRPHIVVGNARRSVGLWPPGSGPVIDPGDPAQRIDVDGAVREVSCTAGR
jgi:hypothetical protein